MIAGIIYGTQTSTPSRLREAVDALHWSRVREVAIILPDGEAPPGFDGPVVRGAGRDPLLAAFRALPQDELHGVLCCPADGPTLSQPLLVDLLQGFWRSGKKIILPAEGWSPMIVATPLLPEFARAQSPEAFAAAHTSESYRLAPLSRHHERSPA